MRVVTASEMRALDRRAMEEGHINGSLLMENAGRAVVSVMERTLGSLTGKRVAVLCGGGNNGGDGFVIARYLSLFGAVPEVMLLAPPERFGEDARTHFNVLERMDVPLLSLFQGEPLPESRGFEVVVDAMLGTGATGAPRDLYASAIQWINQRTHPKTRERLVVAVDIPSGVDADTGATAGEAVEADITVTFAYAKRGHFLFPGAAHVGQLYLDDIGFPWATLEKPNKTEKLEKLEKKSEYLRLSILPGNSLTLTGFSPSARERDLPIRRLLAKRYPDSNKGDFGYVAIVSGSKGMCGAPALVARAAQRTGAGLVTVLAPASAQTILASKLDEQMTISLPEEEGAISVAAFDTIAEFARKATLLCIGPGLTTHPGTVALVQRLIAEIDRPIVLDADGLNALALRPEVALQRPDNPLTPLVLTPHPGEAARLLGCSIPEIQADRVGAVRALAQRYNSVALLKGRYTLIAGPTGDILVNTTGNPGMATGGSGDTLTGILGSLLARQVEMLKRGDGAHRTANKSEIRSLDRTIVSTVDATVADTETVALAAHIHGLAADLAIQETGETSLIAGDIIAHLGRALRLLEEAN